MRKIVRVKYKSNGKTAKGYGIVHRGELISDTETDFRINREKYSDFRDTWSFPKKDFYYEIIKKII